MKNLLRMPLPSRAYSRGGAIRLELLIGCLAGLIALAATIGLQPLLRGAVPFAFAFVAVTLATFVAGWRSGIVALATAQLTLWWAVLDKRWSFELPDSTQASALGLATMAELVVLITIALYQREVRRAWASRNDLDRSRELLVRELAHRVKNTLAVVQSVARQSLSAGSRIDALAAFEARLANIAASHDLLTENNWQATSVAAVVERSIATFRVEQGQFDTSGPDLAVGPKRAVNLSLGLHELATNALKYGALSVPDGRVEISWEVGGGGQFTLTWAETGGPPVEAPRRRGFGSRMIERGLAAEMGGEVDLLFEPAGLICVIRGPAEQLPFEGGSGRSG